MSDLFPPMRCDEVSRRQIMERVKNLEFVVEALIKMLAEDQKVELLFCSKCGPGGEIAGCFLKYKPNEEEAK